MLIDIHIPAADNFIQWIRREPIGVVLDIAAWNYTLLIPVNVVVPAILALQWFGPIGIWCACLSRSAAMLSA